MTELEKAEQFKRLFVDPAVNAMSERVQAQLAPIVRSIEQQTAKDEQQDRRIASLEGRWTKALVGFGMFSLIIGVAWGWIKDKIGKWL